MSIHQKAPTEWVPLTEEIFDKLYLQYCAWIENLTEIRQRMAELRKAHAAGWKPDDISQANLDRLNANDEWNAHHNMENARTVLLCAEYRALAYLPGARARANEICLALTDIARPKPSPEEMAKFAEDMRAGRIPGPGGYRDNVIQFKPRLGPKLLGKKGRR